MWAILLKISPLCIFASKCCGEVKIAILDLRCTSCIAVADRRPVVVTPLDPYTLGRTTTSQTETQCAQQQQESASEASSLTITSTTRWRRSLLTTLMQKNEHNS